MIAKPNFKKPALSWERFKRNAQLQFFALKSVPLIAFTAPRIWQIDSKNIQLCVKHRWRNNNHLGSLYFGAFAIGADVAAGFHAMWLGEQAGLDLSLAFGSFEIEFLKRAHGDVVFVADSGEMISNMIAKSRDQGVRVTETVPILAWVEAEAEPVARMRIGLSLRVK